MPKMDSGPTGGPPSGPLSTVWVTLTKSEAQELLAALQEWSTDPSDPGWHTHVTDSAGNELTVAVE